MSPAQATQALRFLAYHDRLVHEDQQAYREALPRFIINTPGNVISTDRADLAQFAVSGYSIFSPGSSVYDREHIERTVTRGVPSA